MATQTFPCPFCGKKMGVAVELLGHKVRCPNPQCKQVVLAPLPGEAPPPPVVTPAAIVPKQVPLPPPSPPPPPEPHPLDDLPLFNLPQQESPESIFGERLDEGDDVFSSAEGNKLVMPDLPPPDPMPTPQEVEVMLPPPAPAPPAPTVVPTLMPTPAPIPILTPLESSPSTSAVVNPWAGFDAPQQPLMPTSAPIPIPVPIPVPAIPAPRPSADVTTQTFAPEEPTPERVQPRQKAAPERRPVKTGADGGNGLKIAFFAVLAYALAATGLAIYGMFFKSGLPAGHPLSAIPDNFGEYAPAERKKTGKLAAPIDGELPPELRVALGEKLTVGHIEVQPLTVEERKLRLVIEGKNEKRPQGESPRAAFVLRMKLRNASDDLVLYPLDPAFNRRVTGATERVGTGLVVGKQTFWGGAVDWPFSRNVERVYDESQEADNKPLNPGESREYVVFTNTEPRIGKAVREAKDSLLWRVQLRRGRIDFEGRDIPVTAIVGVEFKASDVRAPD